MIRTQPSAGAWNMAVDESLLASVGRGISPPIVRFYAWEPPCLSLGYAQTAACADLERLAANGWGLVRRITGGRAILHADELTYAVIAPIDEPRLAGGVLESYRRLSEALLTGVQSLGAPVTAMAHNREKDVPVVCFELPSHYEITVGGKKVAGSAQARRKEGILQHGSLPLSGDLARITQALAYGDDNERDTAAQRLLSKALTLESALGRRVSWDETDQALAASFEEQLNLTLVPGALTPEECGMAEELVKEKYGHDDWNFRV